jgi:hypothetical protein
VSVNSNEIEKYLKPKQCSQRRRLWRVEEKLYINTASTRSGGTMELQAARQIIDTLAQGVHPVTGEVMPEDSPYNAPPVIRALVAASRALEEKPKPKAADRTERVARVQPGNQGKPWSAEDDARLEAAYVAGTDLKLVAQELGRSPFGVESRLVKLGKLPPRPGMRFAAAAAAA